MLDPASCCVFCSQDRVGPRCILEIKVLLVSFVNSCCQIWLCSNLECESVLNLNVLNLNVKVFYHGGPPKKYGSNHIFLAYKRLCLKFTRSWPQNLSLPKLIIGLKIYIHGVHFLGHTVAHFT